MITHPIVKSENETFNRFIQDWRGCLDAYGNTKYSDADFKWFRPNGLTAFDSLEKIAEAWDLKELREEAEQIYKRATKEVLTGVSSDWLAMQMQFDLMTAANRAFAMRCKTKSRHFAHEKGQDKLVAGDGGAIDAGVLGQLRTVLKTAHNQKR